MADSRRDHQHIPLLQQVALAVQQILHIVTGNTVKQFIKVVAVQIHTVTGIADIPMAVKGIYYICNAIPTICYALILVGIGLIFNLDKKKTDQMYAEMAAKREAKQ